MKIIAINGSPRKDWNTATLLKKALNGASSKGAETELINLYDLKFQGCVSCFACKRKDKEHGVCALEDELLPVLKSINSADGLILGSPIYLMSVTSGMFAFLERFVFSNMIYSDTIPTVFPKKIPSAFIYTMNITEEQFEEIALKPKLEATSGFLEWVLGIEPETLFAYNTYQFSDYSKYESSIFSEPEKAAYKAAHFPLDCQAAIDMGVKVAGK
ncbi:flavodoxin family protein [Clostridia bacterium]|nr:flavodoxin family protein [Clostridia bacterium]